MQNEATFNNNGQGVTMSTLPFRKPDHLNEEEKEDMPPNPSRKLVELPKTDNGTLERWKFAFQVIGVILSIIITLTGLVYFSYGAGIERGVEKERMRLIEERQKEEAIKKEREERIRFDRLEDKAAELEELKKAQGKK